MLWWRRWRRRRWWWRWRWCCDGGGEGAPCWRRNSSMMSLSPAETMSTGTRYSSSDLSSSSAPGRGTCAGIRKARACRSSTPPPPHRPNLELCTTCCVACRGAWRALFSTRAPHHLRLAHEPRDQRARRHAVLDHQLVLRTKAAWWVSAVEVTGHVGMGRDAPPHPTTARRRCWRWWSSRAAAQTPCGIRCSAGWSRPRGRGTAQSRPS